MANRSLKKMPNITNHQGNASQNYSKLPHHIYENGNYQKTRNECWQGCGKEGTLVCGIIN